nr:MAG TPA: Phospholamban [Caudoviricetes sp.]
MLRKRTTMEYSRRSFYDFFVPFCLKIILLCLVWSV